MRLPKTRAGFARTALQLAAGAVIAGFLSGCATGGLGGNKGTANNAATQTAAIDPATGLAAEAPILDKRSPIKVALILPLSGNARTAAVAKTMRQAGEMALFEFDNPALQLIVRDTKGTPEGAKVAAVEALSAGAKLIIGPLYAASVTAVKPIARQANVPVIAFSSDAKVAGGGVYLASFLAGDDVPRIISHAASQGKRRFAALIPDDDYGRIVSATFRQSVARSGGTIAAIETYPATANGMLAPAKRIREAIDQANHDGAPIDALFVPADQETLPMIGSLMPYAEIDTKAIKLLGSGGWDFPNAGRENALIGGWYPGPDPRGYQEFSQRFAKAYGSLPPRIASLAFDAVSIAINLSSAPKGARYTEANLSRPSGFSGVDGLFRFTAGGLPERSLAILELQTFGANVVDRAPSGFGTAQFGRGLSASRPGPAPGDLRFNMTGQ